MLDSGQLFSSWRFISVCLQAINLEVHDINVTDMPVRKLWEARKPGVPHHHKGEVWLLSAPDGGKYFVKIIPLKQLGLPLIFSPMEHCCL